MMIVVEKMFSEGMHELKPKFRVWHRGKWSGENSQLKNYKEFSKLLSCI